MDETHLMPAKGTHGWWVVEILPTSIRTWAGPFTTYEEAHNLTQDYEELIEQGKGPFSINTGTDEC